MSEQMGSPSEKPTLKMVARTAENYLTSLLMRASEKEIGEHERKAMRRVADDLRDAR